MIDMPDDMFHEHWGYEGYIGTPNNETNGAIVAMLQEHAIDHDTTSKWLLGIMLIAVNKLGMSRVDIEDALIVVPSMTPSQVAVAGFETMNIIMSSFDDRGRRGRRTQR